jgi:hypothetical protein
MDLGIRFPPSIDDEPAPKIGPIPSGESTSPPFDYTKMCQPPNYVPPPSGPPGPGLGVDLSHIDDTYPVIGPPLDLAQLWNEDEDPWPQSVDPTLIPLPYREPEEEAPPIGPLAPELLAPESDWFADMY